MIDVLIFLFAWGVFSFVYFLYSLGTPHNHSDITYLEVLILLPTLVLFVILGWAQNRNS